MSATKVSIGVCEMLSASICACASGGNWPSAAGCNCRSRNLSAPTAANSRALVGLTPQVMRLMRLRSWALSTTMSGLRASAPAACAADGTPAEIRPAIPAKAATGASSPAAARSRGRKAVSMLIEYMQPEPANHLNVRAAAAVAGDFPTAPSRAGITPVDASVKIKSCASHYLGIETAVRRESARHRWQTTWSSCPQEPDRAVTRELRNRHIRTFPRTCR